VLRSWIERVRANLIPKHRIGLAIGRDYIGLARLAVADGTWQVQDLAHNSLDARLFSRAPTEQTIAALANAIGALIGDSKRSYIPVHVSISDAAARVATFELDEFPKTLTEQTAFAAFRFSADGGGQDVCASQNLGRDGAKHLLLGVALDAAWQRCIVQALQDAGIVAWTLGPNALRAFNRYYDSFAQASGALIVAASDSWAMLLWDAHRRVRYARARWRTSSTDHADIATEVERSILAYVHTHPDNAIHRLYVAAGVETPALAAALDARLREPCTQLPNDTGLHLTDAIDRQVASAPLSLAAALQQ